MAVNAETSTWTEKHAEGSELLAPPPHKRADESDIPGFVRCEKCGENVHPNGYRVHLRTCQGAENRGARRKIVQCERCNGWFSRILRHLPNCAGPGARGRGRSNRGEIQMLNREEETNSTRRRLRGKQKPRGSDEEEPGPRRSTSGEQAENSRGVDEEKPGTRDGTCEKVSENSRGLDEEKPRPRDSKSRKQAEILRGVDGEKPGSRDSTSGKQAEISRRFDDEGQGSWQSAYEGQTECS